MTTSTRHAIGLGGDVPQRDDEVADGTAVFSDLIDVLGLIHVRESARNGRGHVRNCAAIASSTFRHGRSIVWLKRRLCDGRLGARVL